MARNRNSKVVAILFNNIFGHNVHKVVRDGNGYFIITDVEMDGKRLTLN